MLTTRAALATDGFAGPNVQPSRGGFSPLLSSPSFGRSPVHTRAQLRTCIIVPCSRWHGRLRLGGSWLIALARILTVLRISGSFRGCFASTMRAGTANFSTAEQAAGSKREIQFHRTTMVPLATIQVPLRKLRYDLSAILDLLLLSRRLCEASIER